MVLFIAQLDALATWLVNPWLFMAGALAVLLPILIHLLNKRKFKVVDWAAMEFLLDADKKNRRRIRLENLILLLLRCLAVFLIGMLLARPFLPTSVTAGLIDAAQFERIVLLDNSLSMQTRLGNESAWDLTKKRLTEMIGGFSQEQADNAVTLILTSDPERRPFTATNIAASSVDEINATIERLEATDGTANLGAALQELEDYLASQPPNVNRVVYLFTDLRRRDWKDEDMTADSPVGKLVEISKLAARTFVVDAGDDDDRNLTIAEVRAEGTLVLGVQSAFDVLVTNHGASEATGLRVKFTAEGALPIETAVDRIAGGETSSVRFNFTFTGEEQSDVAAGSVPPRQVKVELATAEPAQADRLLADSAAYFPARLVRGIPALLIDGDPSADFGKAESFYLRRALAPLGPVPSGVAAEVVTENELESLALDKFQVIFLLNNYRLGDKTAENVQRLEKWVKAGGGLVLMPGDQIDEQFFNAHYWKDGAGLSPLKLEVIRGDDSEQTWATPIVADANHEVLKQFAGQSNPLLENVKAFRWWGASIKPEQLAKDVALVARLSDVEESPLIAEKAIGQGRVVAFSIPADADWHNWPSDPSYLLILQDFIRYLASDQRGPGLLRVGEPILQPVDLTQYELDATLTGPRELKANLQAAAPAGTGAEQATIWQIAYPAGASQGFYELKLTRKDGQAEMQLFAANVDPSEGDLKRVNRQALERQLTGTNIQVVSAAQSPSLATAGQETEIWWYLLWAVVAVLSGEQFLGWFFGRGRT